MAFLLVDDAGKKGDWTVPPSRIDGILSANTPGGKDFDEMMSVTRHLSGFAAQQRFDGVIAAEKIPACTISLSLTNDMSGF
jgi:hypothetical protein